MNTQVIFECPLTKYQIEYIINNQNQTALFNMVYSDYKNTKAFLSLLRTSIDQLKSKNIIYIMQCVSVDEWKRYLENKTSWKIENENIIQQVCMIKCPVNDFLENYGVGIGL
ncbi:hypothetical protein Indivirus_2_66 [Indivirus ILV1]|uniref:Uncharacterized protein n=1 Tax=Indivirus ILV1 TaxID=1977633 RepID=A0A1V0SDA1_9VIRU|nr:hypothetical protein Indivirus_2_66 [Indivirus ILV1]